MSADEQLLPTRRIPLFRWPFGRVRGEAGRGERKSSVPSELVELAALEVPQVLQNLDTGAQGLA